MHYFPQFSVPQFKGLPAFYVETLIPMHVSDLVLALKGSFVCSNLHVTTLAYMCSPAQHAMQRALSPHLFVPTSDGSG
jgi:hypothetical protein